MKVEAQLEDGVIRLPAGVRLKPGRFQVVVQLPDGAVEVLPGQGPTTGSGDRPNGSEPGAGGVSAGHGLSSEVEAYATGLEDRLKAIREVRLTPGEGPEGASERLEQRLGAFAVRDQVRGGS